MSSSPRPRPLRPRIITDETQGSVNLEQQFELLKHRFVFSPLLTLDTRFDLCGYREIQAGVITHIKELNYQQPNPAKIEQPDSDEPYMRNEQRPAGVIAKGLMRNHATSGDVKTGFCVLEELTGLDPVHNPQDALLIEDIQLVLLPHIFEDGREQYEWLESRRKIAAQKGKQYLGTLERMLVATAESIDYAEIFTQQLADELTQRKAGHKGYRSKVYDNDRMICAWAGMEAPELESPLKGNKNQGGFDMQQFAQLIATANAETLKQMGEMFANALKAKETPSSRKPQKSQTETAESE